MRIVCRERLLVSLLIISLLIPLGGCQGMRYGKIACGAVGGALLGWIIGHQYNEDGNGALIGAGTGALVGLAAALDDLPPQQKEHLDKAAKDVHNGDMLLSHGRLTPEAYRQAGF
jgi:hypothetical protein